jgi:hypothetical protein
MSLQVSDINRSMRSHLASLIYEIIIAGLYYQFVITLVWLNVIKSSRFHYNYFSAWTSLKVYDHSACVLDIQLYLAV